MLWHYRTCTGFCYFWDAECPLLWIKNSVLKCILCLIFETIWSNRWAINNLNDRRKWTSAGNFQTYIRDLFSCQLENTPTQLIYNLWNFHIVYDIDLPFKFLIFLSRNKIVLEISYKIFRWFFITPAPPSQVCLNWKINEFHLLFLQWILWYIKVISIC